MTQILSEDYTNLRIYLHPDTVVLGVDPAELQREHRERRRLNLESERNFTPMVTFRGNEAKGQGKFTPRLTNLRSGVRLVPYDTHHNLKIKNELVCIEDQQSNQGCFDRLNVLSNVDIDIDFTPTEIITVNSGSAVTQQDKLDIANLINPNIAGVQSSVDGLNNISSNDVASSVWGAPYSQYKDEGTFGRILDILLKSNLIGEGEVQGTPTVSQIESNLTKPDGFYDKRLLVFTSGSLTGEARVVDTYLSGTITLQDELTSTPSVGDNFIVMVHQLHPVREFMGVGLSEVQSQYLMELWRINGLDPDNLLQVTKTSRTVGNISQIIGGDGENISTVTRL